MISRKSSNVLFLDLNELQRARVMVDTTLILDDVELTILSSLLIMMFCMANKTSWPSVTNEHFTVREDNGVTDKLIGNNNSDYEDGKLE